MTDEDTPTRAVAVTRIVHADPCEGDDGDPLVFDVDDWGYVCADCVEQHDRSADEPAVDDDNPPKVVDIATVEAGAMTCDRCGTTFAGELPNPEDTIIGYGLDFYAVVNGDLHDTSAPISIEVD